MGRTNFAIAGSFMVSMLLSSTHDAEREIWMSQITKYRNLLDMHSFSFDIVKLARERLELVSSAIKSTGEETDSGPRTELPGLGTFDVFLPDLPVFPMALDTDFDSLWNFEIGGFFNATE